MNNLKNDETLFCFNESDYISKQSGVDSKFDQLLKHRWHVAMNNGALNYNIDRRILQSRIISPDQYLFVASLIKGRAPGKRRAPDSMLSLRMPFNENKFNFTKILPQEILFKLQSQSNSELNAYVIVNKSPFEYCSSLLVPSLEKCLPQVLTSESLHLAISLLCLSDNQSLRMGFNSMGAMASVNHLHWHLYYFEYKLAIEDLPVQNNLLQNWPIPAIVFELEEHTDPSINDIVEKTMKIIDFCLDNGQIAHNLFLTRTKSGSIRLFIWLVEPRFGAKNQQNINLAFCEFSGYFICQTEQLFHSINDKLCLELIQSVPSHHQKVLHLL